MKNIAITLFLAFAANHSLNASIILIEKSEQATFQVEEIADSLGVVWGMTFLNPKEMLLTERGGKVASLSLIDNSVTWLKGVPKISAVMQGGLLDVAVPKSYKPGDWIYFTYSKGLFLHKKVTTLARAHKKNNKLMDWQDIVITRSESRREIHFGSRITFDGKGHIFFTVGDRGVRSNSQDLTTHAGSVLRVNMDGGVPADNPFVNVKNALPEIWSFGHRNPQGIVYDALHQRLWANEHGPKGGDEINLILPSRNYGWPVISYGWEYSGISPVGEGTEKPGMEQPAKYYVPSIAPGSLMLYSGKAFPQWKGNLMAGALGMMHLNRVRLDSSGITLEEERLLLDLKARIRCVIEGPEGWIYLSIDSGRILRIKPAVS